MYEDIIYEKSSTVSQLKEFIECLIHSLENLSDLKNEEIELLWDDEKFKMLREDHTMDYLKTVDDIRASKEGIVEILGDLKVGVVGVMVKKNMVDLYYDEETNNS